MITELKGRIERITYTNEENCYTVAQVKISERRECITVVGNLVAPTPGEVIKMQGMWCNHPKFGEQFKIVQYQSLVPATVHGITKYLGSGLIKGIGPVMAKRIVKQFGKETLEVIESEIDKLIEVEGIGQKRLSMISKAWAEQKEIRQVMLFLQSHGVSSGYATKIFKRYGQAAIEVVQENPYRLATDIFGIGFLTADKIAEKLGVDKDSQIRAEAGILHVLNQLADAGHVFYPYDLLLDKCRDILQIDREIIAQACNPLVLDQRIFIETQKIKGNESRQAVYLANFYRCETKAAARLKTLSATPKTIRHIDLDQALPWVETQLRLKLADKQQDAVKAAVQEKVMVITGGPGTGKTTIIKAILLIYKALNVKTLLAASTGRAAKRMSEATGQEAKTIHRLLEFSPQKMAFQKNEQTPLKCDLLIIDEASMIDIVLMHHLLKAVPLAATLILVGDVHQLPSVGPGNVLQDIIDSGKVPVVELNEIFRQAQQSSIIVNAHKVNQGMVPYVQPDRDRLDDFYFIERQEPEEVLQVIIDLVKNRIPRRFGFDPLEQIQVLSPMHKGMVGAGNLNLELQKALNPATDFVSRGTKALAVNDKVMQIRNNYDKEVFNGDIGRIVRLNQELQEVCISFDGREVTYDYGDLDELVLAYAISVHKSQGSEYPAVIIPIHIQHYMLLQRNLLYTAITRGKKLVVLVGTKKALAIAVKNNKTVARYTRLKQRLFTE
jgi:exodeoxyribonuclease V alpha subunit